eukprot:2561475-Amphidinium_carterae.1
MEWRHYVQKVETQNGICRPSCHTVAITSVSQPQHARAKQANYDTKRCNKRAKAVITVGWSTGSDRLNQDYDCSAMVVAPRILLSLEFLYLRFSPCESLLHLDCRPDKCLIRLHDAFSKFWSSCSAERGVFFSQSSPRS